MTEKFDYYDTLSFFVPGMLLLGWIVICFPSLVQLGSSANFPSAFATLLLMALSLFLGQIIQAVASIVEPVIYRTWGGRPSDRAIQAGIKDYLPEETAIRIRKKLEKAIGEQTEIHSLFLFAMQSSDSAGAGRSRQFNSLYAYHRGLLVLLFLSGLILLGSMKWGGAASVGIWTNVAASLSVALLTVLIWHRAKQRAFYYVREVLLTAERVLDSHGTVKE